MRSLHYDLHLHSCLSPCADDEMTPMNLAGMLKLAGIELAALTDHNTARNCPAFFEACRAYGILPVAGMELTTAEEIHMVCLFPALDYALKFDSEVALHRMPMKNRPDLFGHQLLCGAGDEILGEEDALLAAATDLSLDDAYGLVTRHGGACYPAHIDRESGGILAILGTLPPTPPFSAVEVRDIKNEASLRASHPLPKLVLTSSDAHFLTGIPDASATLQLSGETEEELREDLIRLLSGKKAPL